MTRTLERIEKGNASDTTMMDGSEHYAVSNFLSGER